MTGVLGYEKYAAGGCDVGALVTEQLGHKYADELYAIHLPPAIHEQIVTLESGRSRRSGRRRLREGAEPPR